MLLLLPAIFLLLSLTNVINVDAVYLFSGVSYGGHGGLAPGDPTIEPNYGFVTQALGTLAAREVVSGHLPLWNHYEGLGTPLLGEMQSAALFPLTWLQSLPGGLMIEQALLQVLTGVGTFLFLRRLGLSSRAALAGGVLFEFNGIFAWMRSAIFAPTAFLPWLFLVVESLYAANREGVSWRRRLNWIALGGLIAAFAVYAGFPEQVYLYGLLVVLWTAYRLFVLRGKGFWPLLGDLALVAVIGGLLALPVLVAFADFLPDAMVGGHDVKGFSGVFLPPAALPQYLLPYIYGAINLVISRDVPWGSIGGYLGLAPLIAAVAALALPERRPAKIFLAAWIVVALGATQGAPGVYPLFLALPLVKLTASYRYLDASWIFGFTVLAAMAVDELDRANRRLVRRALLTGLGVALAALAAACLLAEGVLAHAFSQSVAVGPFMAFCALFVLGLTGLVAWTARFSDGRRATAVLTVLLALEVVMNFSIPYLSYPRGRKIDHGLIAFLQQNTGFQRIVGTDSGHIDPNYGSYFGVPALNWNDLPTPRLATDYVRQQLDPYAPKDGVLFIPETFVLSDQEKAEWSALFPRQLPNYARAGVKYVLSQGSPGDVPAYAQSSEGHRPYLLNAGQQLELGLPIESDATISGLSVLVGTYSGQANGHLRVDLCRARDCVSGAAALESAADNQPLGVEFDRSMALHPGEMLKIVIRKTDGAQGVALWLGPLADEKQRIEVQGQGLASSSREVPVIAFSEAAAVKSRPVYRGKTANVYELKGVRPYFDASECRLAPATFDEIKADCPKAVKLVRLELALPGWRAFVNGSEAEVRRVDQAFQEIDLPAGSSTVRFVYAPPGVRSSLWIAAGTLLLVLAALGRWAVEFAGGRAMPFRMPAARAGDCPPAK